MARSTSACTRCTSAHPTTGRATPTAASRAASKPTSTRRRSSYARDLVGAGLYHPDSPTLNQVSVRTNFVARKYAFVNSGWLAAAIQYWKGAQRQNPPGKRRHRHAFRCRRRQRQLLHRHPVVRLEHDQESLRSAREGPAAVLQLPRRAVRQPGVSARSTTASRARTSISTIEGNPVLTAAGTANVNSLWTYIVQPPQVYYNAARAERLRHDDAERREGDDRASASADPAAAFYSETHAAEGLDRQPGLPVGRRRHHRRAPTLQRLRRPGQRLAEPAAATRSAPNSSRRSPRADPRRTSDLEGAPRLAPRQTPRRCTCWSPTRCSRAR